MGKVDTRKLHPEARNELPSMAVRLRQCSGLSFQTRCGRSSRGVWLRPRPQSPRDGLNRVNEIADPNVAPS